MAFASTAKGGLGRGRAYSPRVKSSKPQRTTAARPGLSGTAKPGKAGVGGLGAQFGNKPSFKTPPAAKPAPKPAPKLEPQEAQPDSIYNDAVDRSVRREEHDLTDLQGQETAIKRDFGIEDPSDPFNRLNGLKKAYLARQKGQSVALAGRGLLYSGSHERAIARTRQEEEQARAELRKAYDAAIGQIGSAKAGVKFGSEEERAQAFQDWLDRAPEADAAAAPEAEAPAGGPLEVSDPALGRELSPAAAARLPDVGANKSSTPGTASARTAQASQAAAKALRDRNRARARATKRGKPDPGKPPKASIGVPAVKVQNKPKPKVTAPKKGRR